jgi:hypothetical protein
MKLKGTLDHMRLPPVAVILATVALGLGAGGCAGSPQDQVREKVEQFASAAAHRDYGTICRQVLAPALVAHLTESGIGCVQALQVALGGVRDPSLSIGRTTVTGARASVLTLSTARNQQAALTAVELIRTRAGWRILSLGSPLAAAARKPPG